MKISVLPVRIIVKLVLQKIFAIVVRKDHF